MNRSPADPTGREVACRSFGRMLEEWKKRIIEAHGGRSWIESAGAGRGTKLLFALPRQVAAEERSAVEPGASPA